MAGPEAMVARNAITSTGLRRIRLDIAAFDEKW